MIEEQARVVVCDGSFAEVETRRRSGCESCDRQNGCGTSLLGRFFGNRDLRLRVVNRIGARPGEQVVIGLEEQALLNASLAVYAVPVIGLVVGAVVGQTIGEGIDQGWRELYGIIGGLLGLSGPMIWLRKRFPRQGRTDAYQAVILRRLAAQRDSLSN